MLHEISSRAPPVSRLPSCVRVRLRRLFSCLLGRQPAMHGTWSRLPAMPLTLIRRPPDLRVVFMLLSCRYVTRNALSATGRVDQARFHRAIMSPCAATATYHSDLAVRLATRLAARTFMPQVAMCLS